MQKASLCLFRWPTLVAAGLILCLVLLAMHYPIPIHNRWSAFVYAKADDSLRVLEFPGYQELPSLDACRDAAEQKILAKTHIEGANCGTAKHPTPCIADSYLCGKYCTISDGLGSDIGVDSYRCSDEENMVLFKRNGKTRFARTTDIHDQRIEYEQWRHEHPSTTTTY